MTSYILFVCSVHGFTVGYAELHCRTNFSFLSGASHPHELVARAADLQLAALAITDLSGFYGIVSAWQAVREAASTLPLIYGSEIELDLQPDTGGSTLLPSDALVVLACNREGYAAISRTISRGRLRAEKGSCALTSREVRKDLSEAAHRGEVVVIAGGPRSRLLRSLRLGHRDSARTELATLREAFGQALYVELTRHRRPGDRERSLALHALARDLDLPSVATNDVHFHVAQRKQLHDVLTCIRRGCTLEQAGRALLPNTERRLKSAEHMRRLFADLPEAVSRTVEVAERCRFDLGTLRYRYPISSLDPAETADESLARLARTGLRLRLGPERAMSLQGQLAHELRVIGQLGYAGYFLTMWEVVGFCREQNILCQGRGSAANSLVCYALGITAVSPDQIDMLFERFISLERHEPPDIDLDIEHDRREEVIQHVYQRFGRDRAAMVAEVIRYRQRSAVRDVGKTLGLNEAMLQRLARYLSGSWGQLPDEAALAAGIDPQSTLWQQLALLSTALVNFPRHLSIHVGGFVLGSEPIDRLVPLENGRMSGRTVIQWDKDDIEALGIFKVDLLGLGMLNVIARALRLIANSSGVQLDLGTIPREDPEVYAMLQRADSIGVFQIESRAQMNMLPRLEPTNFYDLVVEVALVRPGPIQGGMVHPYLRRRRGEEPVEYAHPALRAILERTLGIPIFQEQVMRMAVAVGGYSPGEADQLRRDMAAWRRRGNMEHHQQRLYQAMLAHGIDTAFAQRIIAQIEGFGSYGFPESHAASFAHLVYVSAYLKRYYPAEFAAALINAQPMGFYSVASIVADAHRHGVPILAIDIQHSSWEAHVVPEDRCSAVHTADDRNRTPTAITALRLGLRGVHTLQRATGERIVTEREHHGPFASLTDFATRCRLERKELVALALAGALRELVPSRRQAIWQATALGGHDLVANLDPREPAMHFTAMPDALEMQLDVQHGESFLERHPLELHRPQLQQRGVLRACDLVDHPPGKRIEVAGLVIVRQRPGGGKMIFMALEDETGLVDIAVPLELFERQRPLLLFSPMLIVGGKLQRDGDARGVLATRFDGLADGRLTVPTRDFH